MSSIVRTRENEANVAGEIELTDEQLKVISGAWDGGDDIEPDCDDDDDDDGFHRHFRFFKKEKEVFFKKEKISKGSGSF